MAPQFVQKFPRYPVDLQAKIESPQISESLQCTTANLSMGGTFVCSDELLNPNTVLRIVIRPDDELLYSWARVVHVIDFDKADRYSHPAGMGLEFAPLEPGSRQRLLSLIDQLSENNQAQSEPQSHRRFPRYVGGNTKIAVDKVGDQLPIQDLSQSGLFFACEIPPDPGTHVDVLIPIGEQEVQIKSVVVRSIHPEEAVKTGAIAGAGVRFLDLDGTVAASLESFLSNRLPTLMMPDPNEEAETLGDSEVDHLLGQLFDGLERGDLFSALGVSPESGYETLWSHVTLLKKRLSQLPEGAPTQKTARFVTAQRAVVRLEKWLQDQTNSGPQIDQGSGADTLAPEQTRDIVALMAQARAQEARGCFHSAWRSFSQAMHLAGDRQRVANAIEADVNRVGLRLQLEGVDTLIAQAEAHILQKQLTTAAIIAKEAAQLLDDIAVEINDPQPTPNRVLPAPGLGGWSRVRNLLIRIVGVLWESGEYETGVPLARRLITREPENAPCWHYLFEAYIRANHHLLAKTAANHLKKMGEFTDEMAQKLIAIQDNAQG